MGSLEAFNEFLARLRSHTDPQIAASATSLHPELSDLLQRGRSRQGLLQKLETRFSRPTLNLGVVGRAKQGKSTLLKALSGLGDEAIPTGRDFTTGAASILLNEASMAAGDARGTMYFHDENSFLRDVVTPYWQSGLGLDTAPPLSAEMFRSLQLPEKPGPNCPDPVTGETLLKELLKVQQDLPDFQKRLTGTVQDNVTRADIRSFVAQTDVAGKRLSTWRAVRRAEIRCAFPKSEAGRIALVDTPGLGQIAAGLEDYVRDTLGNSLDFVLFVRLPPEQGPVVEKQDTQLYNLLARAIPELPLADWCAMVVNRTLGNASVLDIFERGVGDSAMRFSGGLHRVDCTDAEATGHLLLSVLDYVAGHLPGLDDRFLAAARRELGTFAHECGVLLSRAKLGFPQGDAAVVDERALDREFRRQWDSLGVGLNTLVARYRAEPGEAEAVFNAALDRVKAKITGGCGLTEKEAHLGINAPQGGERWFADRQHAFRIRLTSVFQELDDCLDEIFNTMRREVLEVILRKDEGGGFEKVLTTPGADEAPRSPWESLASLCQECDGPDFAEIFERFSEARLSFCGFIQHRILDKMSALSDWDLNEQQTHRHRYPGPNPTNCLQVLDLAWQSAGQNAHRSVAEMSDEVGHARWAFTLEFVDGILRLGGEQEARSFWRILYGRSRGAIWPEVFTKLKTDALARADWQRWAKECGEKAGQLAASCPLLT
jgi:hypothetical protein